MDLVEQTQIVDSIRETLSGYVGQRLKVRANMGRSKIIENTGSLTQVHPQLFIMEVDRKRGRTARQSYQYVDVLTGMVELSSDGESLFQSLIDELNADKTAKPAQEDGVEALLSELNLENAGEDIDDADDEAAAAAAAAEEEE